MSACRRSGGGDGDGGDGEESRGELNDWEVVSPLSPPPPVGSSLEIESDGLIDPNYFAHPHRAAEEIESPPPPPPPQAEEEEEEEEEEEGDGSVSERDSSGWIDPATPRNADASDVYDNYEGDEGFLVEEDDAEEEGFGDLNSGPVWELYGKFGEWWRSPVYVWRTKVGQVGTIWSIAMAAAVVGFVILGRRWYRVRRQNKKLGIRVSAEEKRITQLMFQAVRLNEAFLAVRRVPVVKAQILLGGFQDVVARSHNRVWAKWT